MTLPAPEPLYPEENGFNWTAAYFEWSSLASATVYQFQMSRDSLLFIDIAIDTTIADTVFQEDISEKDGWYHWRVRAMNQADTSAWSEARRFFLMFPVSIESKRSRGQNALIDSYYPNPSRDYVSFLYTLSKASTVQLEIFNAAGERVYQKEEGVKPLGRHKIICECNELAQGAYFARLSSNFRSETVSLVLRR